MRAFHNSREKAYREPFGAVISGGAVSLALDVFDTANVSVKCRLWTDGIGERILPMFPEQKDGFIRFRCTVTPAIPQLLWYSFIIEHDGAVSYYGAKRGRTTGIGAVYYSEPPSFQITVYKERKVPDWYKNGIVYQIFPDRFNRGADWRERVEAAMSVEKNGPGKMLVEDWYQTPHYSKDEKGRITCWDFYGGTLSGIEEKLPYLKELGITALYLNPIFEAASNHRYDTADYLKLDTMLGEEDRFEAFAKKAESYGISIILDGVFNHTGCDSIYFNRYKNYGEGGAFHQKDSPYRSWFKIKDDNSYECWWGVDDLPDLQENDPDYREFILGKNGVVRKWLKAGAKGWRLDVADELPDDFIAGIKSAVVETLGDEGLLMGEVWEDASNKISYGELRRYFLGDELDTVMNYPLRDALIGLLTYKTDAKDAAEQLMQLYENYPHEAFYSALNLIGSHDRARILTMLGDAPEQDSMTPEQRRDYKLDEGKRTLAKRRLWLAALVQMTMPGVPCIYYGDEAGMEGYSDPYNRAAYPWGKEDADIQAIYRNAIALRKQIDVFVDGDFKPFALNSDVFGFARSKGEKAAIVVVNRSRDIEHSVSIDAFEGSCRELLNGKTVEIEDGKIYFKLAPLGSAVFYFDNEGGMGCTLERGSGVICHITSLPNGRKPGNIGEPAKKFINFLSSSGQKYWQILPLNPTDQYGSPYAGLSAFAWNTALIDTGKKTLVQLYKEFVPDKKFERFCKNNRYWLESYALFMALKEKNGGSAHSDWQEKLNSIRKIKADKKLLARAEFHKFCQFKFYQQWKELRAYAKTRGIKIIGDMPIYVSEDSADVWAFPQLFNLDEEGRKTESAGVPPDYFAKEGQLWGNPTYNWDAIRADGFRWWINRLKQAFDMFDYVRLDHFRGFEAYWAVPIGEKATKGRWVPGPGKELFKKAYDEFGSLPIIAEDLGVITPGVKALIAACEFPGMDVMQFFDTDPIRGYDPPDGKIAYTGTHDNQTLIGWCSEKYGEDKAQENAEALIDKLMSCSAKVTVMPLQDVIGLGDEARMNTPGVAVGNWKWQAKAADLKKAAKRLNHLTEKAKRR